ncbi:hypothetical protein [Bacillus velezensis]|uniref:hypothetical protein n=1 Tax=Bacillus velezensis TaxID=492670 RepID=UPI001C70E446|nr:hypothetical protein [Bacillus velezensis]
MSQAITDGDHIYGVVKGTAINHGGKTNGFSVPNPNAQSDVIINALEASEIHAGDISYIESHGTGTSLGDPIEIAGLMKAYRNFDREVIPEVVPLVLLNQTLVIVKVPQELRCNESVTSNEAQNDCSESAF